MMKKTVILMGILGLMASVSFAEWRLDEGSGLLSTNIDLSGASLIGENSGKSAYQLYAMESSGSTVTTNETTITPEIRALATALGNDPLKILDYVRDNIKYVPRVGVYLDAQSCLLAGRGSDWDQAVLLTSLLRAAGYTTRYVKGLVWYDDSELLNQFDMDSFSAWNYMRLSRDLLYYPEDYYIPDSGFFLRVWVECLFSGFWQALDPTFKLYESHDRADLKAAMQYNTSAFTNGALSGATSSADYVKNLNETNVRNALNTYRDNLNNYFKTGTVYTATYETLGTRTIIPQESTGLPGTTPPYGYWVLPDYLDRWDQIPDNCHAKVTISHKGIDVSLKAWEVAGRRLSILYDSSSGNRPFLSLAGKEIGRGTITTNGSSYTLNMSATRPVLVDGSATNIVYMTNSVAMNLISGSAYVLIHDFETTSEKVQTTHRRQFVQDRQVKAVGSEAVTAGALQLVADSYLNQHDKYQRLVGAVMDCVEDDRFLGILASTTNGYFIDLPGLWVSCASKTRNVLNKNTAFSLGTFVDSSLEHGVLEQNQGSDNPAVSTIKLLQLSNASGNKTFYVRSNNWSSIQGQLLNYSNTTKAAISNEIRSGSVGYIPENANITLSNWTGIGYAMESTSSVLMAIAGGYNGGYNASGNSFSIPAVEENQGHSTANNYIANVSYTFSVEPVNLFTGDYVVDHTDLTLGGAAPMGLSFARHYNSASRFVRGVLGNGWQHNFEIRAFEVSQGAEVLGSKRAVDVASALVQLTVSKDLMTNAYDSVKRPLSMLVTKWGMDQLTDRCVVLQFGNRNLTYTKLEDGSYMPPPGETSELRKENNQYVLQERFGTTYTFNTNGFLETLRDADSNTLSFLYSNGRLQSATDAFGRSLSLTYNASNLLYTVSDSTSRQISFAYDTSGNLTNYTDAANLNWGYEYNTNNLLTVARDPEGIVTIQNFYDSLGCVTQQVSATSNTWRFSIGGNQGTEKDPLGNQTVHWFDDDGRNLGSQNALGRTYVGYDIEGLVEYDSDLNDNWTLYIHDNKFNLTRTIEAYFSTNGLRRETFFGYDELNHLRFVTNALGTAEQTVTEYTYTATHHIDTITEAKGTTDERVTDLDYNGNGLLQKKTEGNGTRITEYIYDNYGTPDTVTSTDAGTIDYLYDDRGDLKEKTIDGVTTVYFYDPRRLLTNTVYAVGSSDQISESRAYWNNGLLKAVTDARSKTTQYFWTPAYKQAGVIYPDTGSTTNLYDAADRLTHTRDAKQNWTQFQLDALGRATNTVGEITAVSAQYDPVGNITNTVTDPAGLNLWTRTAYDAFNRPFLVQKPIFNLQYFYDQLGRMTNRIDAASMAWKTEYDKLGRVKKAFRPSENYEEYGYDEQGRRNLFYNAEHKPMHFGFDAQGRVKAITNAIGNATSFTYNDAGNLTDRLNAKSETTHYDYDALNRLTNVAHEGVWKASFAYDANGNITTNSNSVARTSFAYDTMNRLTNSVFQVSNFTSQVSSSYDLNGNRTNIVYPGNKSVAYTYDEENRLSTVDLSCFGLATFDFRYDAAGRMTNIAYPNGINATFGYDAESRITNYTHGAFVSHVITRDPRGFKRQEDIYAGLVPNFTNGLRQTRTHNYADQLLTAGTGEYSYDPNGNLTNSASGVYQWNYDNRLVNAGSTEYLYDGSGARIGRVANGATNYFILDYRAPLKMPLAEADAQGNITRYYIWSSHGLLAHLDMNPTNGAVVATRYYHADEQGSTLALTDGSGAVTDQFAYSPYGQVLGHTGTNNTPYGWLGGIAVRNEGGGLYYMLNRYYSADMRRFISVDPLGIDGGVNLYAYGNLNPLFFVDPMGLSVEVGYRPVIWGVAYHTLLILKDDNTGTYTVLEGMPTHQGSGVASSPVSASGSATGYSSGGSASGSSGYGYGNLEKNPVTQPWQISQKMRETVSPPAGITDEQFRQNLTSAYNLYDNSTPYSPLPGGKEGNSNSLIGDALRSAGSTYTPSKWSPGWNQSLPHTTPSSSSSSSGYNYGPLK